MRTIHILVTLLLCLNLICFAKGQALNKRVSLQYTNETIQHILKDISKKNKVNFSYSNNLIPLKKKISVSVTDKPLADVLAEIFKATDISFEELGSQIVLKKDSSKPLLRNFKAKENVTVSAIANVPVKDENSLLYLAAPLDLSTLITDTTDKEILRKQYVSEKRKLREQYFIKMDSLDRKPDYTTKDNLTVEFHRIMRKLKKEINLLTDSLEVIKLRKKESREKSTPGNEVHDNDKYIYMPGQVTFVAPLGTNGLAAGRTVNNLSFNILSGHSAGVNGFELAGLVNTEKDYMKGAQIAGLGNVVGNDVEGVQVSGLFNVNGGYTEGVQLSGLVNIVSDTIYAVQAAGFLNHVSGECQGTQFAGFMNSTQGNIYGGQAAGFLNVAGKKLNGAQAAGFLNVAGGNVHGAQVAGFMNVAPDTLEGAQVAGFLNIGAKVVGSQIGFINIADTVTGAQIGFISFSRKGYRRLEFSGNEILYGNVAFKTGSNSFYNIFTAGVRPSNTKLTWGYGYGIGTEAKLNKRAIFNLELLCTSIHEDGHSWDELNLLNQVKPSIGILLGNKTSLFVGPTLSVMVSNHYNSDTKKYGSALPPDWTMLNTTDHKTNVKMWIGFNAGIRF